MYIYIYVLYYPAAPRATKLRGGSWKSKSRSPPVLQFLVLLSWKAACLLQVSNTSKRSARMFLAFGQKARVYHPFSRFPHPRALPKILTKTTFESDAPRLSKMTPGRPKSILNL